MLPCKHGLINRGSHSSPLVNKHQHRYDLIVIGAGPAGERAATLAAGMDKNVAQVERGDLGGSAVNTGTLPSKTLRETALYLSGLRQRGLYGVDYTFDRDVTVSDIIYRQREVVRSHQTLTGENIARHSIELFRGTARLIDPHTVRVEHEHGRSIDLDGQFILLATGSRPYHPTGIRFDAKLVHDSDSILRIQHIPSSIIVIGAGIIGCEYATLFSALGIRVSLIDNDDKFLPILDEAIAERLMERMRELGISLVFERRIDSVRPGPNGGVTAIFQEGDELSGDITLFCVGRSSNVEALGLEDVGVLLGDRGCIAVNESFQTTLPNIYAAGDVIGSPALASTSMQQAHSAVQHMFGSPGEHVHLIPTGIYTIPEVAMIGPPEQQLREKNIPYRVGQVPYRINSRAQIVGDTTGLLKLLFDPNTHRVLAVHIIGEQATELIHIGQACMYFEGTLQYFIESVFNFPTLADLYKHAAYNGLSQLL